MDNIEQLAQYFKFYSEGSALAHAILDDYCEVVSKLEGVSANEVHDRIVIRANQYVAEQHQKTGIELKPPQQ